jgi:hypothetical protein
MFDQFSSEPQENLLSPVGLVALNSSLSPENAVIVPASGLSPEQNINQPVTVNPADSLLLSGIGGLDTAGTVTLVNNNSSDALTGEAMNIAKGKLLELAQAPDFIEKMNVPFGENWNREVANTLKQNWLQGDFSFIPPVEIVSKGEIAGANGAFAQATDTIYLSQKFLRENGANSQAVADVLLEEIGHSIDSKINIADSPGDEGEIFAVIVQGKEWSLQEFLKLKANDDNGIITIGGINLPVEQSRIKKQRDFNGDNISDLLRQEKGARVDNARDAEVYLSNGYWGFKQQSVLPNASSMNGDLVNLIYGDFNGDYKTDFIRQEKGGWVNGINDVQIFISKGDGTFQNPINMNDMGAMNGNVANLIVGDFTGGGADDIIRQEKGYLVNGVNDTQFYTYSNGNFVKVKDVPDMAAMNGNYTNLIAGDFDGNGITDLLRQEKGSWINNTRDAEVYLSNGYWGFKQQSVLPNGSSMNGDLVNFIPGYFNADNKTDLIRQEKGGWVNGVNDVQIFISKGDGTFLNPVNMNEMGSMNGNNINLIVGDFTGGGADDIIRQEKGGWVNGINDTQFYTYSNGNFVKVKDVPDMAAMNGNFVNLAPQIDGASSYPYAPPPVQTTTKPTVSLSVTDSSAAETTSAQTANPGQFTFTRTGITTNPLTVYYTTGGTAIKGTDYQNLLGSVTIPAGLTTATIPINVIDDTLVEGSETAIVNLSTNTNYNLGTTSGTVTIADNDVVTKPTVSLSVADSSAAETTSGQTANPGQFTFTRTGITTNPLTVYYTTGGTAIKGTDYQNLLGSVTIPAGLTTANIPINVIDDTLVEGSETAIVNLSTNTNYNLGTTSGTVTIADNDFVTPDLDIQLYYPYNNFTSTQRALLEKAAQNWESIITRDKVPTQNANSGVLKIAVTQGSQTMLGGGWSHWAESWWDYPQNYRHDFTTNNYSGNNFDGDNRIHFSTNFLNSSSNTNNNLVRLSTHELGHTLGLDEAQYDSTLGLDSIMDSSGIDQNITEGVYQKLEWLGYSVNRNPSLQWS